MKKLNLKLSKGITLISLVTTVVVIILLTGMIVYNSPDYMHSKKLKDLYNDIETIQDKVQNYYARYNEIPGFVQYYWVEDTSGVYYIVDLQSLDSLTLNYGSDGYELYKNYRDSALNGDITDEQLEELYAEKDIFIFNAETLNVFYVEGLTYDGVTYYSLAENEIDEGVLTPPVIDNPYLVDVVEIGDYVDIGIGYTNLGGFRSDYVSNTYASTGPTGWRVLSKSGNGDTGTVTLVSAGTPLSFYNPYAKNVQTVIDEYFDKLNTEITIVSSGIGFRKSGFIGVTQDAEGKIDLASLWSSKSKIINASTAHAMTTTELETAYEAITGTVYTMKASNSNQLMKTDNMTFKNTILEEKAKDLLGIGITYWLCGLPDSTGTLWHVGSAGTVRNNYSDTYGVRTAVSLKSGVQLAADNTGTGASESEAYKLLESGDGVLTPQLSKPVTEITGNTLTITEVPNATSYEVYVNGTLNQTITSLTLDLTTLNLEVGTYEITVKAKADGYGTSDTSNAESYTVEVAVAGEYLVDKVEIGDYVDIGIDYTNQSTFYPDYVSNTYASTGMTGWRVLSKNGEGAEGTVTLVSAGTPLTYYHPAGQSEASISNLSNLNTILQNSASGIGYRASGFEGGTFDLASVWSTNSDIIDASTAHAMTTSELETAYEAITGTAYTMTSNGGNYLMRTSNMTFKNTILEEKAKDLLGIGIEYWLGGSSYYTYGLWRVNDSGFVSYNANLTYGVRSAVSLNSGVKIAGDNTGTGADVSTAYKLAE